MSTAPAPRIVPAPPSPAAEPTPIAPSVGPLPGPESGPIAWDPVRGELVYRTGDGEELGPAEREAFAALAEALPAILAPLEPGADAARRREHLGSAIDGYLLRRHPGLAPEGRERIRRRFLRDALGFGPIDPLLSDPEVEDVSCSGPGLAVYVHHARFEGLRTDVVFPDERTLEGFVQRLAQRCGRPLSVAHPLLDGSTPEGHRVQATFARAVSPRGPSFTLRRLRERPWTPVDLMRAGTVDPAILAYLWLAAEEGDSAIVCGGPGAGKTSLLNALTLFVPPSARIVSIEDTRELQLPHPNWIAAATRGPPIEVPGESPAGPTERIGMHELLAAALRQRPTHLLVGEVRGREAHALFQAMQTGHVTLATVHADSARGLVARLTGPPVGVPKPLFGALRTILVESVTTHPSGLRRRLAEVVEVRGVDPVTEELWTDPVFRHDPATDRFDFLGRADLFDRIAAGLGTGTGPVLAEFRRRAEALAGWLGSDPPSPAEFWRWAHATRSGWRREAAGR
ncbi:MAG: type II/IV secretion system ATPase subunit [Thermoplasmata archaeon]